MSFIEIQITLQLSTMRIEFVILPNLLIILMLLESSNEQMQTVFNLLTSDFWACELKLYDSQMNLAASSKRQTPIAC